MFQDKNIMQSCMINCFQLVPELMTEPRCLDLKWRLSSQWAPATDTTPDDAPRSELETFV